MTAKIDTSLHGVSRAIEGLDVDGLRRAIQEEYTLVAAEPERGFHFHTGRRLAAILAYDDEWLDAVPEATIASFAGTGNPFSLGPLTAGEHVVDVGCGAGIDSIIAARKVGATGSVIGVDMTPAMIVKAREGAKEVEMHNESFGRGSPNRFPSPTAGPTSSSQTASSTFFPISLRDCRKWRACSSPAVAFRSATSSSRKQSRTMENETSISGRPESPVLCWTQSFRQRSPRPDSSISRSPGVETSTLAHHSRRAPRSSAPWESTFARERRATRLSW